ncbi:MAG: hypothetical protein PHO32_04090 [Candidatus Cloacimonetes bacterium]|nr:hypothetical protein [Candidatus Cloacimonadota bacterium]
MTDFYKGKLDEAGNLYIKYGLLQKWHPIKCEYNGQKPCGKWCQKFGEPHEEYFGTQDEDEDEDNQSVYRTIVSICYDTMSFKEFIEPEREDR